MIQPIFTHLCSPPLAACRAFLYPPQMRTLLLFILILLLSSPVLALTGRVVNVADGDTVTILDANKRQNKIRLYGIDCPEKKQAFGQRARQFLAGMIAGKTVDISDMGPDRYGRTVGLIELDGISVNREMVKNGFAWVYRQYCKIPECRSWIQDEDMARNARLGLWQDWQPVPPWEWRQQGNKISTRTNIPAISTGVKYSGNIRSRKYHNNYCQHFTCKNCIRYFNSPQEPVNAGFVACKLCGG